MLLGRYLTETDAMLFAISIVLECLLAVLLTTDHKRAEVVIRSRLAIEELQNTQP